MLFRSNESTPSTNLEEKTSTFSQVKSHRKVTWKTKIMEGKDADSDDSDDIISSSATIRFQHTPSVIFFFFHYLRLFQNIAGRAITFTIFPGQFLRFFRKK